GRGLLKSAMGDAAARTPTKGAIVGAGDLADRATIFRSDLAFAESPAVPKNPHAFLVRIDSAIPLVRQIALGAQDQLATFLASDYAVIVHREPSRLFEPLLDLNSLEDLDYIP